MITSRYSAVFLKRSPFTPPPHRSKTNKFDTKFSFTRSGALRYRSIICERPTNVSTDKKLDSAEVTKRIFRKSRVKNSQKNISVWATHHTCTNMCFGEHKVQITCYDDTSLASGIRTTKVKEIQKFERKWLCTAHRDPSCQFVRFQTWVLDVIFSLILPGVSIFSWCNGVITCRVNPWTPQKLNCSKTWIYDTKTVEKMTYETK